MRKTEVFPKTIAAARKVHEARGTLCSCQWELGDVLIEECGPPGGNGVRTGSDELLKKASRELEKEGFPYAFDYLRDLRQMAHNFSAGDRSPAASWTVHLKAKTPENLTAVIQAAKVGKQELTCSFASKWLKQREAKSRDPGSTDLANAAIVAEKCVSEAADICRRIEFLTKALLPKLDKIEPETAFDIANRMERVAHSAQEMVKALRDHARSASSEAAE